MKKMILFNVALAAGVGFLLFGKKSKAASPPADPALYGDDDDDDDDAPSRVDPLPAPPAQVGPVPEGNFWDQLLKSPGQDVPPFTTYSRAAPGPPPIIVEPVDVLPEEPERAPLDLSKIVLPSSPLPPPDLAPGEVVPAPRAAAVAPLTETMLRTLLAKEASPNWKAVEPTVTAWQQSRALVADGKFGPKSAEALAAETGLLPIVRYWPRSAQPSQAVPAFQKRLLEIAAGSEPAQKLHLKAAAQREQGQGFGTPPKPITPLIKI
jgi:hypothetical protein